MKPIKMFGLAGLLVLTTMAFAGVSSAMAESTALCDQDPGNGAHEVCPASHLVAHVHEVTVGKMKILTNVLTVECDALFLGDVTSANNLGNPLEIAGHYTYMNCGSCTVTEESAIATLKVLKEGHEKAKVTGEAEFRAVCGAVIKCTYNWVGLNSVAKGPLLSAVSNPNGESVIQGAALNPVLGPLCPTTRILHFTTTPLVATYITE